MYWRLAYCAPISDAAFSYSPKGSIRAQTNFSIFCPTCRERSGLVPQALMEAMESQQRLGLGGVFTVKLE